MGALFDKWCQASKVKTMDDLRELLLLEEFKNCLPERVVIYLNEQKVSSITAAAVLADEFALTHKSVFSPSIRRDPVPSGRVRSPKSVRHCPVAAAENRECFYCHEIGHLIAACPTLKRKEQSTKTTKSPSPVGLIHTKSTSIHPKPSVGCDEIDEDFRPFVTQGSVSLVGEADGVPITILRDTGAKQTIIREGVLPFSADSYSG